MSTEGLKTTSVRIYVKYTYFTSNVLQLLGFNIGCNISDHFGLKLGSLNVLFWTCELFHLIFINDRRSSTVTDCSLYIKNTPTKRDKRHDNVSSTTSRRERSINVMTINCSGVIYCNLICFRGPNFLLYETEIKIKKNLLFLHLIRLKIPIGYIHVFQLKDRVLIVSIFFRLVLKYLSFIF